MNSHIPPSFILLGFLIYIFLISATTVNGDLREPINSQILPKTQNLVPEDPVALQLKPRQDDDDDSETEKPTLIRRFANLLVGSVGVFTEGVQGVNNVINDTYGQGSIPGFFFNGVYSNVKPIAMRPTRFPYTPRPVRPGVRRTTAEPADDPYSFLGAGAPDEETATETLFAQAQAQQQLPPKPVEPVKSIPSYSKYKPSAYDPGLDSDTDDAADLVTERWHLESHNFGALGGSDSDSYINKKPPFEEEFTSNKFDTIAINYFEGTGGGGGSQSHGFSSSGGGEVFNSNQNQIFDDPTTARAPSSSGFHLKLLQSLVANSNNNEDQKPSKFKPTSLYEDLGIKKGSPIIVNDKTYPDLETYLKEKGSKS